MTQAELQAHWNGRCFKWEVEVEASVFIFTVARNRPVKKAHWIWEVRENTSSGPLGSTTRMGMSEGTFVRPLTAAQEMLEVWTPAHLAEMAGKLAEARAGTQIFICKR